MCISGSRRSVTTAALVGLLLGAGSVPVTAQEGVGDVEISAAIFSDAEMSAIDKEQYDLSDAEISRAQRLKVLDRSYGVSNLSALELLGKYAKTEAKRMEYARKHVIAMADNVGRSQAWGMAVYTATQETNLVSGILASNPIISEGLARLGMALPSSDYSDLKNGPVIKPEAPGRTLMVSLECGDSCDEAFAEQFVLVMENKIDHIDVVFVDSVDEDADGIFSWAKSMGISKAVLESGQVNLHIDDDSWRDVRNHKQGVPRLIRK